MSARIEEIRAEIYQGDVAGGDIEWLCRVAEAAERLTMAAEAIGADVSAEAAELRQRLDQRIIWDGRIGQYVVYGKARTQ